MNVDNLTSYDLNLLVIFQILMEERNVSKTAQRMHVTQSAVSKTLKRLRDEFDDPLFSRTAHGLAPTAKAIALHQQLPDILNRVNQFFNAGSFEPKGFRGTMHIAGSDIFSLFIPHLVGVLHEEAPRMKLHHSILAENFLSNLMDGSLDFALYPPSPTLNHSIVSQPATSANSSCILGANHPLAKRKTISLDDYLQYPHIRHITNYPKKSFAIVDDARAKLGKQRNIILETQFLSIALHSAIITDSIITGASTLNLTNYLPHEFKKFATPAEIERSSVTLNIYYHARVETSAAHLWLRDKIIDLVVSTYN